MFSPEMVGWAIGRADAHYDRDAQQLEALREARSGERSVVSAAISRVRSLIRQPQADESECAA